MRKPPLFILFLFIAAIGCEETAEPITSKNPYAEFSVVYNATTNKSTGTVYLWENAKGGRLAPIDGDEQLLFQDRALQYQTSNGSYQLSIEYFFTPYTFKLIDLKKKEFVNSVSGNRISFPVDIQYDKDSVNTSFPVEFKWDGVPLDTNESITLNIETKKYIQDTLGSTKITISESDLALYKGKSISAMLERYKKTGLQQKPGSDGSISVLYIAQPRTIYFNEGPAPLTNKNVYAEFIIVHDAATAISTGTAQFWEATRNGTPLFIDQEAILQYQNVNLQLETGTGKYSNTIIGFLTQNQIRFVDINKKEFINTISGTRINLPSVLQGNADTVNTALPLNIAWSEASIDSFEKAIIRISDKSFVQDTLGKKSITIPASGLSSLKGTTHQVFIERIKETALQQKLGTSGTISNRYIAVPKTIHFK